MSPTKNALISDETSYCTTLPKPSIGKVKVGNKRKSKIQEFDSQPPVQLKYKHTEIISTCSSYKYTLKQVEQVAPTETTVLILGETGTGKELLASRIHELSRRCDQHFIKVNCAAIPETLFESELFGHEKGAFTGATFKRSGKFMLASKGTIFLDEIAEIPLQMQAKLLRVLQNGEFYPLGSSQVCKSDIRVIAATNQDLEKLVCAGEFRKDLFFRLNIFPIHNIPLRERKADIPELVRHFLIKHCQKQNRPVPKVSQLALEQLKTYHYPGNIRELENMIERALIVCDNSALQPHHFLIGRGKNAPVIRSEFLSLEAAQKQHILTALELTNWQVSGHGGAAELLVINPKTLHSKMSRLSIKKPAAMQVSESKVF